MKKNIIFYFTDQQRSDTCGCFGQPLDITPNLDALASEGVKFDNAFTPQPVCGPCRSIFQTGKYATDTGCYKNGVPLPDNVKTLANYIEEAGYETAYIGKWHLAGNNDENDFRDYTFKGIPPEKRGGYSGFWRASDVLENTSHGYDGYVFDENEEKREFKGYRVDGINDFALEFLENRDENRPFFLTVSHIEPHHQNDRDRYEGPKGSKEKFADFILPKDLEALGGNAEKEYPDYLGQVNSIDKNLGKIIEKLKEKGLYENTVVIFASDHGSHFLTRNKDEHLNGYDDYKRTCHDSALKVPLVISGGDFTGGVEVKDIVSTESLPKTILAIAGIDVKDAMIGENLLDVVKKKNPNRQNFAFAQISESRVGRCVRTPDYLYSVYAPGLDGFEYPASDSYSDDFLYDMKKDPYQLRNVVKDAEYSEIKKQLRKLLADKIEEAEGFRPEISD
ncbi:MAG: sulfatase-like hydrolase/transferase [Clostridiales bacterium]|nr:sulfatase-like hydrolase/transferase [Clostridiales bacterium]